MEIIVFILALLIAAGSLYHYLLGGMHRLFHAVPNPGLGLVRAAILFTVPWFTFVFLTGAASDIVGFYVIFYVAFATAALLVGSYWLPVLELYFRADVMERSNLAAGIVLAGFTAGTAFAFGGALTGEGPGWIVVFVFFLLAYAELRAAMAVVSRVAGGLAHAVRVERDTSAAVLLAGVAMGAGLIAGRAAAGDFTGWVDDLKDYGARLWPILIVPLVAAIAGWATQTTRRPLVPRALVAVALVAFGAYFYFLT